MKVLKEIRKDKPLMSKIGTCNVAYRGASRSGKESSRNDSMVGKLLNKNEGPNSRVKNLLKRVYERKVISF